MALFEDTYVLGSCLHSAVHKWFMCLFHFLSFTFSLSRSLFIARPTPSSLTPTVTTCTVYPPLSTWLPLLTSPRRNACECTHTHIHARNHSLFHCSDLFVFFGHLFCIFRRASAAVNHLKRFHDKKKQGPKPHSLYLDHIVRKSVSAHHRRETHTRVHRDIYAIKVHLTQASLPSRLIVHLQPQSLP